MTHAVVASRYLSPIARKVCVGFFLVVGRWLSSLARKFVLVCVGTTKFFGHEKTPAPFGARAGRLADYASINILLSISAVMLLSRSISASPIALGSIPTTSA